MTETQAMPGFTRWFCQQIREKQLDPSTRVIVLPFRPLNDQEVVIYLRTEGDKVIISDDGEVFSQMFVNYGFDPSEVTKAQTSYIQFACDMHGITFKNGEFFASVSSNPEREYGQVLHFVQAILPVYYTMMVQLQEREINFAHDVFVALKKRVPNLVSNRRITIGGVTRNLDLYLKHGSMHKLGRTISNTSSIDTTLATWEYIDKAILGIPDFESTLFSRGASVTKIAIYDSQRVEERNVKILKARPGHVFAFPGDFDAILSALMV